MSLNRRPIAIMPCFNEADILHQTTHHLIDQGFDVHVIDNWSTDRSLLASDTRCSVSMFPVVPNETTHWANILREVERIAALPENAGRWIMFNDADEIRYGPDYQPLTEWFWDCQKRGHNAVQFTVRNYVPTSDLWNPARHLEDFFTHYEKEVLDNRLPHVKAWYSSGQRVDLHSSGGHVADFHWMSVDPTPGILKHYPIRSQSHGERKVFKERNARWSVNEKLQGWHQQYRTMKPGYNFIRSTSDPSLIYDECQEGRYRLKLVTDANNEQRNLQPASRTQSSAEEKEQEVSRG